MRLGRTKSRLHRQWRDLLIVIALIIFLLSSYSQLTSLNTKYVRNKGAGQEHSYQLIYADAQGSVKRLLQEAQRPRPIFDEIVNVTVEEERCKRYGLTYSGRRERRRIFYGGNIADDSWHIIGLGALENYGVFHTVAFSESNRTQMHYPRNVRFTHNSSSLQLLKRLYGPNTKVHVEQYVNEKGWPHGFGWEGLQTSIVIERWKSNGMADDDIGYIADVDEFFSRDYIRAMQICDVKQFDDHGNCYDARISAMAMVFEGGPKCRTDRVWGHPDLTIGSCIEGISSNASLHPKPERGWKGTGWLDDGYTKKSKFHKLPVNATHFPLFNAHDFRRVWGERWIYGYNAFHLHNFFPNAKVLRNKYKTYGEPIEGALDMALGEIHSDVKSMINCALNKTEDPETRYKLVGLDSAEGLKGMPFGFKVPGYVEERMAELESMLLLDRRQDSP